MSFKSINPFTGECYCEIPYFTQGEIRKILFDQKQKLANLSFQELRNRRAFISNLSRELELHKDNLSILITREMGKPILQSQAEVEKCIALCRYFGEEIAIEEILNSRSYHSKVVFEPMGRILLIMPWNFPLWQVIRCAIPILLAGNSIFLKHAEQVPQIAIFIEKLFHKAGFPIHCFTNLFLSHRDVKKMISSRQVQGVCLTGGLFAGRSIAKSCGDVMIPYVLELGGSDPSVVWNDIDEMDHVVQQILHSRFLNNGQSCIATKRLYIHQEIIDKFIEKLIFELSNLKSGYGEEESNFFSCLAREELKDKLSFQVQNLVSRGAEKIFQYKNSDGEASFSPMLLKISKSSSEVVDEELFGPVLCVQEVNHFDQAIHLSNSSKFGLGASIFTKNESLIDQFIHGIESGMVSVNKMMASDWSVPFGGIKNSGFGRELGVEGFFTFMHMKTIIR
jgi:succinate-semialdehyde dehydrogenase/glutarate-semialdehyde dehydrogenase